MLKQQRRVTGTWIAAAVCLAALMAITSPWTTATADDGVNIRPIEDFLDAQTLANGSFKWISEAKDGSWEYRTVVDFTGVINRDFVEGNGFGSAGTTFTGKVTERVQSDGRTLVHVSLHGKNVLAAVWNVPAAPAGWWLGQPVWGYPIGWINQPFRNVSLDDLDKVDVHFDMKFLTPAAPGSTLPVLRQLAFNPSEGQEIVQQEINLHGTGELRSASGFEDGKLAQFTMTMKGIWNASFDPDTLDVKADPWPIARIDLRPVGK